jgi:hypothetical protein
MTVEIAIFYVAVMESVFGVIERSIVDRMGGRAGNATDGDVGIAAPETMIVKSVIQTMSRKMKKKMC